MERLRRAIDEYEIQGVETTLDFGRFVLDHPAFVSGKFDTGFVGAHFDAAAFEAHTETRRGGVDWSAARAVLDAQQPNATAAQDGGSPAQATKAAWRGRYAD